MRNRCLRAPVRAPGVVGISRLRLGWWSGTSRAGRRRRSHHAEEETRMRTALRRLSLVAGLVALLATAAPVAAITHGQDAGGGHPYAGPNFFYDPSSPDPRFTDPGGWFNCSGTLISPTVVLTAGHCTFPTGLNGQATADGNGGNDTWFSVAAEPDYTGIAAAPFIPDD